MKKVSILLALTLAIISLIPNPINAQGNEYPIYDGNENYSEVYSNLNFADIGNHWAKSSIYKMGALSIMKGKGESNFGPQRPVTRQEALALVVRLIGLEEEAISKSKGNILDGYIKTATSQQILTKEEANQLDGAWQSSIEREKMAAWIGRALKLTEQHGLEQQLVYTMKDWRNIDNNYISIIEAVIQKNIMNGDTTKNFNPKVSVKKGEMAKILENAHEEILKNQGYTIETGTVKQNRYINQGSIQKNILEVQKDDNTLVGLGFNNQRSFITYKNGNISFPQSITTNDYIKYYLDKDNKVIYVEVIKKQEKTVNGRIQDVDIESRNITIKDNNNVVHNYEIIPNASINANGTFIKIEDLLYDQDVEVKVLNGKVIYINGYIDEGDDGYIHPGERVYTGKVLYIDKKSGKLTVQDNGKQEEYLISPFIPVIKNSGNVGIEAIKEGDIVRLEFDEQQGNTPMKLRILEPDRQVSGLYQGNISYYNNSKNQIILKSAKKYNHTLWESEAESVTIDLNKNTPIYVNGRAITRELLRNYLNRDAYIAMGNNLGKEEALKIVLKNGYEQNYQNTLQSIRFGDRNLTIDYTNVYYDDSTIIIKDGRLIDPYNLKEKDELYVSSHGMGNSYTASIISVEGTSDYKDTGYLVYRGSISEIYSRKMELKDSSVTDGIDVFKESKSNVEINDDTKVLDVSGRSPVEVSIREFLDSGLLGKNGKYKDKLVYTIAKDGIAQAITIIEPHQNYYAISLADIDKIDRLEQKMTIKNVRDWRDFGSRWTINNSTMNIFIEDAIIIKNGKPVTINELRGTENIYIMRGNNDGYIIICR